MCILWLMKLLAARCTMMLGAIASAFLAAGATAAVAAVKQGWSEAQSARTAGNTEDAVAKGKAAESKLADLMASLGMSSKSAAAK